MKGKLQNLNFSCFFRLLSQSDLVKSARRSGSCLETKKKGKMFFLKGQHLMNDGAGVSNTIIISQGTHARVCVCVFGFGGV